MIYNDLTDQLCRAFPELKSAVRECASSGFDPGQYIVYEDVFVRYIESWLVMEMSPTRNRKLREIFGYLESLFLDGGEVENLAYVAILENRPGSWLHLARPFLGHGAVAALDEYDLSWRERARAASVERGDFASDRFGIQALVSEIAAEGDMG